VFDAFYSNTRIKQMQAMLKEQKEREDEQYKMSGYRAVPTSAERIKEIRQA